MPDLCFILQQYQFKNRGVTYRLYHYNKLENLGIETLVNLNCLMVWVNGLSVKYV